MAFTKDGRVLVSPKSPLGMDEFAALYSKEGRTPDEAASFIHLNYPMEAKSLMERNWRALGINEAPESYFKRNPVAAAATGFATDANPVLRAGPMGPMPAAAVPLSVDRNPSFRTPAERNIAIATGAYDPSFASPMQRLNHSALLKIEQNDRAGIRARADELEPIALDTPANLRQSQLMGDTIGLQRKIIDKMPMTPGQTFDSVFKSFQGVDPELKPYIAATGYGALEGAEMPTRLDRRVYDDPDFQEALRKNPEEAAYAYRRITGRTLKTDIDETLNLRKTQVETGRKYAQAQIAQGANRDPVTGQWKVWNMAEPEDSIGLGNNRANRMFIEATPEQQRWLDTHYEAVTGGRLPQMTRADLQQRSVVDTVMKDEPNHAVIRAAKEKELKRPLTPEEDRRLAATVLKNKEIFSPAGKAYEANRDWMINQRQINNPLDAAMMLFQDLRLVETPEFDMSQRTQ